MVEKISVQIELEGGAEIQRQLADIGTTGQKAFQQISQSAEQVGGFRNIKPDQVTAQLKQMGITGVDSINKIQAAVAQAARLETVVQAARATENALAAAGVAAKTFAIGLAAAATAAIAITRELLKFANAGEETEKALTQLQAVTGQSFQNLSAMAIVFEQGGTKIKQFATEFGNLSDKIQQAGITKATRDWNEVDKTFVKWANDVDHVTNQFDVLATSAGVTFSRVTTGQTKVEALLESLSKAGTTYDQWNKLADIFRNLSAQGAIGAAEVQRLGKALGLSPETIARLTLGADKLQQMQQEVVRLGLSLDNLDKTNLAKLRQSQTEMGALWDALKDKMGAIAAPAFTSFWQGFTDEIQRLIPAFQQLATVFGQLDFSRLGALAGDFLLALGRIAAGWAKMIADMARGDFSSIQNAFAQLGQQLISIATSVGFAMGQGIVSGIIAAIAAGAGAIWNAIKQALGFGGGGSASGGGAAEGMAGGGLIGGRGTGTSDSNLAWVSRGEHIMPARAVQQPGVLAFLEALRRSGGSLTAALNGMAHFSLGGRVPQRIPAFAGGGLVGGMSNVTIHFPGIPPISGLRASSAVVDELRNAAALAQVRSGGRKPSRYS